MRHLNLFICLCLLFSFSFASGQGNFSKYKVTLSSFSMPATATLNSHVKVQGYIKNIGKKPVPPGLLMNFKISDALQQVVGSDLPTFAYTMNTGLLFEGDSLYYEYDIYVDDQYFKANQKNIVTIWPLMEKNQDPNSESVFTSELYVGTGNLASRKKADESKGLEKEALVSVYPNPAQNTVFVENRETNQDLSYIIAYDINGAIVLEKSVEITSKSTKTLDLSSLVLGKYELAFFNSKGVLIRTQKIIKIE